MTSPIRGIAGLFVAAGALILASCAAQSAPAPQDDVVATVNGERNINFDELRAFAVNRFYDGRSIDRRGDYRAALDRMIVNELRWLDFYEKGLHEDRELLRLISRTLNEELVTLYFQTQYEERYINDESIAEAHSRTARQVHYNQITVDKPVNASEHQLASLRDDVEELRVRIVAGESIEDVARDYSTSAHVSVVGGAGDPVDWSSSLTNRVEEIIFEMSSGDVRVFEAEEAFMIAQVARIDNVNPPPLAQVRQPIREALTHRYLPRAITEYEEERSGIVRRDDVSWNETGLNRILGWARQEGFFERDYDRIIEDQLMEGDDFLIATYDTRQITLREYKRMLDEVLTMSSGSLLETDDLKSHLVDAIRTEELANRARALGLEERLLTPESNNPAVRSRVVWLYDRYAIERRLPSGDEAELRAFYESNSDSLFYQFETANTYVIESESETTAKAWRDSIDNGTAFEAVTGQYFVRSFYRFHDGEIRTLHDHERPYLGEIAFNSEIGDVQGPVAYDHSDGSRRYALVKKVNHREARQMTYDEVRDRIPRLFRNHHWDRLDAEVNADLKDRYGHQIYDDVLERKFVAHSID
jgi:hypothetical protein